MYSTVRPNIYAKNVTVGEAADTSPGRDNLINSLLDDLSLVMLVTLSLVYFVVMVVLLLGVVLYRCYCLQQQELYEEAKANVEAMQEVEAMRRGSASLTDKESYTEEDGSDRGDRHTDTRPPPSSRVGESDRVASVDPASTPQQGETASLRPTRTSSFGAEETILEGYALARQHQREDATKAGTGDLVVAGTREGRHVGLHSPSSSSAASFSASGVTVAEEVDVPDANRWCATFMALNSDDKSSARSIQSLLGILTVPPVLGLASPLAHRALRGDCYRWQQAVERRQALCGQLPTVVAGGPPTLSRGAGAVAAPHYPPLRERDDLDTIASTIPSPSCSALVASAQGGAAVGDPSPLLSDVRAHTADRAIPAPPGRRRAAAYEGPAVAQGIATRAVAAPPSRPLPGSGASLVFAASGHIHVPVYHHQVPSSAGHPPAAPLVTVAAQRRSPSRAHSAEDTAAAAAVCVLPHFASLHSTTVPSISDPNYGTGLHHRHMQLLDELAQGQAASGNAWSRARHRHHHHRPYHAAHRRRRTSSATGTDGGEEMGTGHSRTLRPTPQQRLELTISMLRSAAADYPLDTTAALVPHPSTSPMSDDF